MSPRRRSGESEPPEGAHSTGPDPERLRRNAFALILARLGRRDHTEAQLLGALARKGFPAETSRAALEQARREGLVDDERFARTLARLTARDGKRGPRRLVASLRQKGIPPETARAATAEAFADSEESERNLVRFAGRLLDRARAATLKERRIKVLRSLLGRGFSLSTAKDALRLAENARMTENTGE